MKYKFLKLGAAFMMSIVVALEGSSVAQAASVRAGLDATLADYLSESRMTISQKEMKEVSAKNESAAQDKENEKKETSKDNKKESKKTICGYTNLGVAKVDNYLNVRAGAGEDESIVGKLPSDAGCEILGKEGDWYHITSGKVSGYVKCEYIVTGKEAEKLAQKLKKDMAIVNTMTVYIREKPNTDCTILTIVTEDEELEVVKEDKDWVKVKLDDENGYVNKKYVEISEELKKAMPYTPESSESQSGSESGSGSGSSSLAQTALSYVGGRYVWGGTSLTSGVDCSGFTMQIMAKYGVYLPHNAAAQSGYGRSVSTSELQAGDLIFYGSAGAISHVAIYIGNGQIVHASNSRDGIKVSNAFYRTPVCCRRMF